MDQERFAELDLCSSKEIWRDEIENYKIVLVNEVEITNPSVMKLKITK